MERKMKKGKKAYYVCVCERERERKRERERERGGGGGGGLANYLRILKVIWRHFHDCINF